MSVVDNFFLKVFPYLAVLVALFGSWARYRFLPFTYSSLSSAFLEARAAFWGSIPFHIGILLLLGGHLLGFLFPRAVLVWNGEPLRLLILEITAFAFGLCVLWGLALLFLRRLSQPRVRVVTSPADFLLEIVLLLQVLLGLGIAATYRWGSSWYASVLTPYLWSLLKLSPQTAAVAALPLMVKLHILGGFLILLILPFTRLVHLLVAPLHYIPRPYQRVLWNWDREQIRHSESSGLAARPRNS